MITIHCNGNPLDYKESVNYLVHQALNEMIAKRSKSCTVAAVIGAGNTENPHTVKFTLTFKGTPKQRVRPGAAAHDDETKGATKL